MASVADDIKRQNLDQLFVQGRQRPEMDVLSLARIQWPRIVGEPRSERDEEQRINWLNLQDTRCEFGLGGRRLDARRLHPFQSELRTAPIKFYRYKAIFECDLALTRDSTWRRRPIGVFRPYPPARVPVLCILP